MASRLILPLIILILLTITIPHSLSSPNTPPQGFKARLINSRHYKPKRAFHIRTPREDLVRRRIGNYISAPIGVGHGDYNMRNTSKWQDKISVELKGTAPEVWALLVDFLNINKSFLVHDTCYQVRSLDVTPQLIRACIGAPLSHSDFHWIKVKLLMMDAIKHRLSFEIIDNDTGYKFQIATVQVLATNDHGGNHHGCKIEWSFVLDPIGSWISRKETYMSVIHARLQRMANKLEHAL